MKIHADLISYDKPGATYHLFPPAEPGNPRSIVDMSTGEPRYVIAVCHDDLISGEVHIITEDEIEERADENGDLCLGDDTLASILYSGFKVALDIVDQEGEHGRLVLRHEHPNGLTQSFN